MKSFPGMEGLFAEAFKAGARKVGSRLHHHNDADIQEHFSQYAPKLHGNWNSDVSPISEFIIGLFRAKGWAVYNQWNGNDSLDAAIQIASGPVDELVFARPYRVVPLIEFPQSQKAVLSAIQKAEELKVHPELRKAKCHAARIMVHEGSLVILPTNSSKPFPIEYRMLKSTLATELASYSLA